MKKITYIWMCLVVIVLSACEFIGGDPAVTKNLYYVENCTDDSVYCIGKEVMADYNNPPREPQGCWVESGKMSVLDIGDYQDTIVMISTVLLPPERVVKSLLFLNKEGDTLLYLDKINNEDWEVFDTTIIGRRIVGKKWKYKFKGQ